MSEASSFSRTYHDKADEARAFREYAPFRYGEVEIDPQHAAFIAAQRASLDPILVDIVDGGIEAAVMEAEAAVERTARSTIFSGGFCPARIASSMPSRTVAVVNELLEVGRRSGARKSR